MALAIFDLDNTLLAGDSDQAWGEYVCETGLVDGESYRRENAAFFRDYEAGRLDIHAYLRHALLPLAGQDLAQAEAWHRDFMAAKIEPMFLPAADALLQKHRDRGDELLIITATNRYITAPIAARMGVEHLLACEVEIVDGRYTGASTGVPSIGAGKVERLRQWGGERNLDMAGSWFYSDSHNDLPLLEAVDNPVAVDPDGQLLTIARQRGWPIISLR